MQPPPLGLIAECAARRAPDPAAVAGLATALVEVVGPSQISTVEAVRRAASTDYAHLSPLLADVLPKRPADLVVTPQTVDHLVAAVRLAHAHRVPITPRGAGTGNYGQAVPLAAGLVVDLRSLDRIIDVGDGWIRAEAGTTFVALEAAARRHGQELAMMPTTVGSTLGGFLAGGAGGVGSIEHGWLWDGFVHGLDVVTCPPGPGPIRVPAERCRPYLHAYGVTGIIAIATVGLAPLRPRIALFASFAAEARTDANSAGLALIRMHPAPRLVSLDDPELTALYPPDRAIPSGRYSLRAIVDADAVDAARTIVETHDGRVNELRPGATAYLTSLAFNHVTLRARKARPQLCHLQVSGAALVSEPDRVRAALPGAMLHLDGLRVVPEPAVASSRHYGGLLLAPFPGAAELYRGIGRLRDMGVYVVDPHTWLLDGPALPDLRVCAAAHDPDGLLNPGRWSPDPRQGCGAGAPQGRCAGG